MTAPPVYSPAQVVHQTVQPKAVNNYKLERSPTPPVYLPQQVGNRTQLKPTSSFRLETRPAPPVYRPTAISKGVSAQRSTIANACVPPQHTLNPHLHGCNLIRTTTASHGFPSPKPQQFGNHLIAAQRNSRGTILQQWRIGTQADALSKNDRPTAIGDKLFLFTKGKKTTDLIVSAHGGAKPNAEKIDVPGGLTLHFYVRHGEILQDPGLVLPAGDHPTKGPGRKVPNYVFTKYQGEATGETYEKIVARDIGADVLTVRKRNFYSKEVTLKEILSAIQTYGYTDIYLNACRYVPEMGEGDEKMRHEDIRDEGYGQVGDGPDESGRSHVELLKLLPPSSTSGSSSSTSSSSTSSSSSSSTPSGSVSAFSFMNS